MEERLRDSENAKSKLSQEKGNLKRDIESLEQNISSANSMLKAMEEKFHEAHSQYESELRVCICHKISFGYYYLICCLSIRICKSQFDSSLVVTYSMVGHSVLQQALQLYLLFSSFL